MIGLFAGIGRLRARHTDTTTEVDPAKRRTLAVGYSSSHSRGDRHCRLRRLRGVGPQDFPRPCAARSPTGGLQTDTGSALITDLHVGPARGVDFTRKVVDIVNSQNVDLIAIGGDPRGRNRRESCSRLLLRSPIFARPTESSESAETTSSTPMDGGKWLDVWETLGITTLRNSRTSIQHGGDTIRRRGHPRLHVAGPVRAEPDCRARRSRSEYFRLASRARTASSDRGVRDGYRSATVRAHSRRSDVAAEVSRSAAAAFGARLGQGRKHSAVHDAWRRGLGSAGTRRRPARRSLFLELVRERW